MTSKCIRSYTGLTCRRTDRVPIICEDGITRVPLTRGMFALIDASDIPAVSNRSWRALHGKNTWYAVAGGTRKGSLSIHRCLMNPPKGVHVDHINGDGLDCRRQNLRLCNHSQNQGNKTAHKGLCGVMRDGNGWRALIKAYKHSVRLGHFSTAEEAARAYDFYALAHWGEFARLNFPGAPQRHSQGVP